MKYMICEQCGAREYSGNMMLDFEDLLFCHEECLHDYIARKKLYKMIRLTDDDCEYEEETEFPEDDR
mgnify:CR=1 FL=1